MIVDDFQICLYSRKIGEQPVPIGEIAALPADQRGPDLFKYDYTEFRWTAGGKERLVGSFNELNVIVRQLEPTRERVAAGLPAILRAGVDDTEEGYHWLFDPAPDDRVSVFVLATEANPWSHTFPVPYDSPEAQGLYAFVERDHDALIRQGNASFRFEPFTVARGALVAAFERESKIGSQLLNEAGIPMD